MILELKVDKNKKTINNNMDIFTNEMINKITKNLENFHYNVIVANLHEIYNYLSKNFKNINDKANLLFNYQKILIIISPVLPHFANECLNDLNFKEETTWPKIEKKLLKKESFDIVIQINGKKRDLMNFKEEIDEKDLLISIKNNERIIKFLENKKIKKSIYIRNKLINLII